MKRVGIQQIDRLILSHDDIDHIGGYDAVGAGMTINRLLTGPEVSDNTPLVETCANGQRWLWDEVSFEILPPPRGSKSLKDNNNSCVVQIIIENDKLLLIGDVEREVETQFVKYFAGDDDNLSADVVVVPHHGSLSSSSEDFVRALKPTYA